MRLWHYRLIPYLPNQQLIGQWREIHAIKGSIDKNGTPNHPLVNKVLEYPIEDFKTYTEMVYNEMKKRGFEPKHENLLKIRNWKSPHFSPMEYTPTNTHELFFPWHSGRYLKQCYYNLQEKFDCGMINEEEWRIVYEYVIFEKTH